MGVPKRFLLGAAELTIVVTLIYTGIEIFGRAEKTAEFVTGEQNETEKTLAEYDVIQYDGFEIPGAIAMTYIKEVIQDYELSVKVTTSTNTFTCTDRSHFADFRDISSIYYINPMHQYLVTVIRDENDALSEVEIVYVP